MDILSQNLNLFRWSFIDTTLHISSYVIFFRVVGKMETDGFRDPVFGFNNSR